MKGQFKLELVVNEYVKMFIPQVLLTMVTLGIYYPWALVKITKAITGGLTLGDRKFKFNGDGGEVFSLLLVQMLLTLVTAGIYYPFAFLNIRKYFTEKLELDGKYFQFDAENGCDFWVLLFVQNLLAAITCGIYYPWAMIKINNEVLRRTQYDGQCFSIKADGGDLFSLMLAQYLLTFITLGIYGPWAYAKITSYLVSHIYYGESERFQMELDGGEMFSIFLLHSGIPIYIVLYIIAAVVMATGSEFVGSIFQMIAVLILYGFMPWFAYKLYGNFAARTQVVDA